jgi:hypothetical protein
MQQSFAEFVQEAQGLGGSRKQRGNVKVFKESPSNKSIMSRSIADFKQSMKQSPRRRN